MKGLEDKRDTPVADGADAHVCHYFTGDLQGALTGAVQRSQHMQKSAFSLTGTPGDRDGLPLENGDVDPLQHIDLVGDPVAFVNLFCLQDGFYIIRPLG